MVSPWPSNLFVISQGKRSIAQVLILIDSFCGVHASITLCRVRVEINLHLLVLLPVNICIRIVDIPLAGCAAR